MYTLYRYILLFVPLGLTSYLTSAYHITPELATFTKKKWEIGVGPQVNIYQKNVGCSQENLWEVACTQVQARVKKFKFISI